MSGSDFDAWWNANQIDPVHTITVQNAARAAWHAALATQPVAALPVEQVPTLPTKDELMDEIRDVITGSEDLMSYSPEGGVGRRLGVAKENMNRMIDQLFAALATRQPSA